MEHMVFGDPITEETLRGMDEYKNKTTITRTDKARVALTMKNVAEAQAFEYIEKLKKEMPAEDPGVITYGNIHNATGDTITYSGYHDYSGKLASDSTYPVKIVNGKSGMFKHEETSGKQTGSRGAVVYRGKDKDGKDCDWMYSWSNPNPIRKDNKVYTEIAKSGSFDSDTAWVFVDDKLSKSGTSSTNKWSSCDSTMTSTTKNELSGILVDAMASIDTANA